MRHPLGGIVDLPLLVPSFSSKGFLLFERRESKRLRNEYSEIAYHLQEFGQRDTQAGLISTYDLHHRHFEAPDMISDSPEDYLQRTILTFIDSGGYELAKDFDSTEPKRYMYVPKDFSMEECKAVLHQLTSRQDPLQLVITNFDDEVRGMPLDKQISEARTLFEEFPGHLTNFLMKPWNSEGKPLDPSHLSPNDFQKLQNFPIIGVTEKELGKDLIVRLTAIADLRKGLDDAGINAPIHVWGGLDPIITPLYFFAGADIFDGISWLRYAYRNGVSICRDSFGILDGGLSIRTTKSELDLHINMKNLSFLNQLSDAMMQWSLSGGTDYSKFEARVQRHLESAYHGMQTRIPNLEG